VKRTKKEKKEFKAKYNNQIKHCITILAGHSSGGTKRK